MENQRIYSLDALKILAIFGVIVFHTYPFLGISPEFYRLFRGFWGFNVPVFFIISGYLFALKVGNGDDISWRFKKNVRRLFFLLFAWSAIYLSIPFGHLNQGLVGAFFAGWHDSLLSLIYDPATILGEGVRTHLWFIIALITAMSIVYLFVDLRKVKTLVAVAVALYLVGLLTGKYAWSPLGFSIGFNTRNGPFQATLFVTLGVLLAQKNYRPSMKTALLIFTAGLIAQLTETALLYNLIPRDQIVGGEYYIGTVPYALGMVLLALAMPNLGKQINVQKVAPYVLGIYMIQFVVITYLLKGSYGMSNLLWQFVYAPFVFLLSLLLAFFLGKIPFARKLVIP